MTARLGSNYKIGGDGWWHLTEGVPILETDVIRVIDITADFTVIEVSRDNAVLGHKPINHCFFHEDFELLTSVNKV